MKEEKMHLVVIEVRGGVAEVVEQPENVTVVVRYENDGTVSVYGAAQKCPDCGARVDEYYQSCTNVKCDYTA
jgi:reverse gyrase